MILDPWIDRAPEEANHFNPAYCGALIYEFTRAYENAKRSPASYALIFCALPIVLHAKTRGRLPSSTVTRLLPWLEKNQDLRVGFAERARSLTPYVREALRYAVARDAIRFVDGGCVAKGDRRASFTPRVLEDATPDIQETVHSIRMTARWFAVSGDVPTILAAWGIRV